jgi:drug/metabolite transporter (DMT)-like permease
MLGELLNTRQLTGCALMLAGMILSQLASPGGNSQESQPA